MATETARCIDCGTALKAVPTWLATAHVSFTCNSCPRKPSRGATRFEPAIEPRSALAADPDLEVEPDADAIDDLDDDVEVDLDLGADDLDDVKEEKEL